MRYVSEVTRVVASRSVISGEAWIVVIGYPVVAHAVNQMSTIGGVRSQLLPPFRSLVSVHNVRTLRRHDPWRRDTRDASDLPVRTSQACRHASTTELLHATFGSGTAATRRPRSPCRGESLSGGHAGFLQVAWVRSSSGSWSHSLPNELPQFELVTGRSSIGRTFSTASNPGPAARGGRRSTCRQASWSIWSRRWEGVAKGDQSRGASVTVISHLQHHGAHPCVAALGVLFPAVEQHHVASTDLHSDFVVA